MPSPFLKPESLIDEDDLKAWLGYTNRSAVEKWLVRRGVDWDSGCDGKIVTTRKAIEEAFNQSEAQAVSF